LIITVGGGTKNIVSLKKESPKNKSLNVIYSGEISLVLGRNIFRGEIFLNQK
jgi:hypothetical protein